MLLNISIALCLLAGSWAAHAAPPPPGSCSTSEDCSNPLYPCCSPWGFCGDIDPWCTSSPPPPPPSPPPPSPSPPPPSPPPPSPPPPSPPPPPPSPPPPSPPPPSPPPPSPPPPSPPPPSPPPPPAACDSPLFGNSNGVFFNDGGQRITALRVRSGCVLDGIQVQINNEWQPFRGTESGSLNTVTLSANEYIYQIWGRTGADTTTCGAGWAGQGVINLQLGVKDAVTGQVRQSASFGTSTAGTSFSSQEGEIVGFWGFATTGSYMKGIGVTFQSCPSSGRAAVFYE